MTLRNKLMRSGHGLPQKTKEQEDTRTGGSFAFVVNHAPADQRIDNQAAPDLLSSCLKNAAGVEWFS
jgi:hypothetical protein